MSNDSKESSGKEIQVTKREAIQKASDAIESAVRECGIIALKDQPAFLRATRTAYGIKTIKAALTDQFMQEYIMPLQNSALGFLTDKQDGGYPLPVVRECLCEALLRGFQPASNEFNIISGRFYGAKNGFDRIVREYPGLRNLRFELAVPHLVADKGALVAAIATWTLDGQPQELRCEAPRDATQIDTRIPVRVNAGMGPDAILGKAERKLLARIYKRISGAGDVVEADASEITTTAESLPAPAAPEQDGKRMRLGGKNGNSASVPHNPETGEVIDPGRQPGEEG